MEPLHALAGEDQVPIFAGVAIPAWEGPFGRNPGVSGLGGRLLEGGLCASLGTLVNQSSNSVPATAVTQASWGVFFNIMKMNTAPRIPFGPGFRANCLRIY